MDSWLDILREPCCRSCQQTTSGDCGGHGPLIVTVARLLVERGYTSKPPRGAGR